MTQPDTQEAFRRKSRAAGLTMAIAMGIWILMQWLGPKIGLSGRYAVLIDLAVIAAMIWGLVLAAQLWRARNDEN